MKRSDIVELIASNLYNWYIANPTQKDDHWDKLDKQTQKNLSLHAEILLSLQEAAGMMPPKNGSTTKYNIFKRGFESKDNYIWEPEDEAK